MLGTTDKFMLPPGRRIAERYLILEAIGAGGMASVYRARDLVSKEEVALKVLDIDYTYDEHYVQRFIREVELMNRVSHPNVIRTYDIGTDGQLIYFTMELVLGGSLERRLERNAFDQRTLASFITQLCLGLQEIHRAEIIHRDLKPGNILFTVDGKVKITDFGVARPKGSQLTKKHQKVGSVCYMAPEIWLGRETSPLVDYYSLGVVLYEVVTGDVPFDSGNPGDLMAMHVKEQPDPPSSKCADVPVWLDELILMLLQKSPERRPQSLAEVIEAVRLKQAPLPSAPQPKVLVSGGGGVGRALKAILIGALLLVAGAAFVFFVWYS